VSLVIIMLCVLVMCIHDKHNLICVFVLFHLVNDSSLRGGFMLNFLDDGQGMTQGKGSPMLLAVLLSFLSFCCNFASLFTFVLHLSSIVLLPFHPPDWLHGLQLFFIFLRPVGFNFGIVCLAKLASSQLSAFKRTLNHCTSSSSSSPVCIKLDFDDIWWWLLIVNEIALLVDTCISYEHSRQSDD